MAVQIPGLKRFEAVDTPSLGRIEGKVPELNTDRQSDLANKLAKTGIDYAWHVEDQAMDTAAIKAENEYRSLHSELMYGDGDKPGAIHQQGDPTAVFKSVEEKMNEARERILGGDMSDRTRAVVDKRLREREEKLRFSRDGEFSTQLHRYTQKEFEASQKLRLQDYTNAAAGIEPENDSTFGPLDDMVRESFTATTNHAVKLGGAVPDENGGGIAFTSDGTKYSVKLGNQATLAQRTEISSGISGTVETVLLAGGPGSVAKAQAIIKRYDGLLLPEDEAKLKKRMVEGVVDKEAWAIVGSSKSYGEIAQKVSKIADEGLRAEIREKAEQRFDDREKRNKARVDRSVKAIDNQILEKALLLKASDPDITRTELDNDPDMKILFAKGGSLKGKERVYKAVLAPPSFSDDKALREVNDLVMSGELDKLPDIEYQALRASLKETDRKLYDDIRGDFIKPETRDQIKQRYASAEQEFQKQLLTVGELKRDQYSKTLTRESEKKYLSLRNEFIAELKKAGPGFMTPSDINAFAREAADAIKKKRPFEAPETPRFQGRRERKEDPPPPPPGADLGGKKINGQTIGYWTAKWKLLPENKGKQVSTSIVTKWALEQ